MTTEHDDNEVVDAGEALADLEEKMTFGGLVRSMRECDEVSQAELAKRLSVSRQFLNAIENGRKQVSVTHAKRIAEALGYSPSPFVHILIQEELRKAGLNYKLRLTSTEDEAPKSQGVA